jgi:hypothetical protein
MRPSELRRLIRDAGRVPYERTTRYTSLRSFGEDSAHDELLPLDGVGDATAAFGSYTELIRRGRKLPLVSPEPTLNASDEVLG